MPRNAAAEFVLHISRLADIEEESRRYYAYVGLNDRSMVPLLRPGMRQIEDEAWATEHHRPMYLVEVRDGYRCAWFARCDGKSDDAAAFALALHAGNLELPEQKEWSGK